MCARTGNTRRKKVGVGGINPGRGGGAAGDSRPIGASCIRKIQVLMLNDQIKRLKSFRFCGLKGH